MKAKTLVDARVVEGFRVLEAPVKNRAPKAAGQAGRKRAAGDGPATTRRDPVEDFARRGVASVPREQAENGRYSGPKRFRGVRFRLKGGVPKSTAGKVASGVGLLVALAGFTAAVWMVRGMLLRDARLLIPSSSAIQIAGNSHLTRAQLLSVFGEDVGRSVLSVPLEDRKAELEALPWVQRATVMRLLPNRVRVAVTERKPVAFVREGGKIALVDGEGVLLDMSPEAAGDGRYSFPVVTGINEADPDSTRAARMKLYQRFVTELDAESGGAEKVSKTLSDVDVSNPEDVRALLPAGDSEVLVHFGEDDFGTRYKRYVQHVSEWKAQYPKLSAVDMRYERQVVLDPGAPVKPNVAEASGETADKTEAVKIAPKKAAAVVKPAAAAAKKAAPVKAARATGVAGLKPGQHLEQAFDVHSKDGGTKRAGPQGEPQ